MQGDKGATALEFALIVPILLLLVIGIINFGLVFGQKLALNQAVREGARAAVVAGTGQNAQVTALVRGASGANSVAIVPANIAVAATPSSCAGNDANLKVTATYVAPTIIPIPAFPNSFTLTSEAVYRCEW